MSAADPGLGEPTVRGGQPRVHVYSEAALPVYYQPLQALHQRGSLAEFGLHSLRVLKPLAKNALLRLGLVSQRVHEPLAPREVLDRLTSLRHLRSADVMVLMLEPFDNRMLLFAPLKEALTRLGIRVLYYTSWHDWDSGWQPRDPLPGVRAAWDVFLRDLTAVCVTQAAADALEGRAARTVVIPHPVDDRRFMPARRRGERSGRFRWITVSRLVPGKGLEELVDLFRERGPDAGQLTIVGDGPLGPALTRRAEGAAVDILPFDGDRLPDMLRDHDAFVLNSYRHGRWEELFGMVLIEAMACGLPVVATDCVGPRAILRDGETGLLVPQQNASALRQTLERIEKDPALRDRLAGQGQHDAVDRFALDKVADSWLRVLQGENETRR